MASDFLMQLDTLNECEIQARFGELHDQMQHHLESSDAVLQAELINVFVQKTVIHVTESEAELILKVLLPAAVKVCDRIFEDLKAWEDVVQISNLLQAPVHVLEGISACCQCVLEKDWRRPSLVADLLQHAFQGVKATYAHCQGSSELYGAVLESVNEPLTRLFRAATALQVLLHQLADTVATSTDLTQQQLTALTSVCDDVAMTGRLLTRLDTRAMAEAWKCYLRLLQLLPDQLPAAAQLPSALTFMVGQVADRLADIRQMAGTAKASGAEKSRQLTRAMKMCSFYLKLIVGLSESYITAVRDTLHDLVQLVLTLTRYSAPDGHVADLDRAVLSQLSSQLTVASEPLLDCLLEDQTFPQVFWSAVSASEHLGALCRLRCCLALARRACHLPEPARTNWTTGDERHLVAAVLRLVPLCDQELTCCVPLECAGDIRPRVSLYEHAVASVCSLVGSLTAPELRATETHLWRHLCRSGGWASLLATDTLCFVARYGPAGLCRAYCRAAAAALARRRCPPLSRLLSRLLPLLAAEHRAELLRDPPAPAAVLLRAGCPPGDGSTALLESALHRAEQLAADAEHLTADQLHTLVDTLCAITVASVAQLPLSEQQRLRVVLERLCSAVPPRLTGPAGTLLAAVLLRATATLPDTQLTDTLLTEALPLAFRWLPGCSVPVKLGVISLLRSVGSRRLRSSSDQHSPTQLIPKLYQCLLTDASRLVQQRALDAFAAFASCTPHSELISAAVSAPAGLQARVSGHLRRLAGRPRDPAQLSDALRRAGASSCPPPGTSGPTHGGPDDARVTDEGRTVGRGVTLNTAASCRPLSGANTVSKHSAAATEDSACVSGGDDGHPAAGQGAGRSAAVSEAAAAGDAASLSAREVSLLDSIQRRLDTLRRERRGPAADGGRLLRLLTDIEARLDAG